MKIDENCINHNAVRLIDSIIGEPIEYAEGKKVDLATTLGEARGVLLMAEALKEVLKQ